MCIFCKIINNEIPCYKVYDDDEFLAFLDISQATIGHTLIVPKKHVSNILEIDDDLLKKAMVVVKAITSNISKKLNVIDFNILNNCGPKAGQTVDHFHIHVIPRYKDNDCIIKFNNNSLSTEEFRTLCEKLIIKKGS